MTTPHLVLPVLNVCSKDVALARLNLELCAHLDGVQDSALVLAGDDRSLLEALLPTARLAFRDVTLLLYEPWRGSTEWPSPQNHAWQQVARNLDATAALHTSSHPAWLWWEADACPLRPGWLRALTDAYLAPPRALFAGHACRNHVSTFYMNGVGLWPFRLIEPLCNSAALYTSSAPFDVVAGPVVKRSFRDLSALMLHHLKAHGGHAGASFRPERVTTLLRDHPSGVLFHGSTDGSLPSALLGRPFASNGAPPVASLGAPARPPGVRRTLHLQCPLDCFSGFGQLASTLARGLLTRGHLVRLLPTRGLGKPSFQRDIPPVPSDLVAHVSDLAAPLPPADAIIEAHCGLSNIVHGGEVVLTMWEATGVSPATVACLSTARRVLLPSVWNATSFSAAGVTAPISVLPLGVDPLLYPPQPPRPADNLFIFGTAGRWAHGGCRKGIEDVIAAFTAAFPPGAPGSDRVRLHVKCFEDCQVGASLSDPRITLDRRYHATLAPWYAALDVFVTASRGEGWGLHSHEALASARPVIATRFGGISEFYDDSVGWPLAFSLEPARDYYEGRGLWAEPDHAHLVALMRHVASHPADVAEKGAAAARRASTFSTERMIDTFEALLTREGLL